MKRIFAICVLSISAVAQPQTFTITAEKIKKSSNETSNSVTVITSEEIIESGAKSLTDVIQALPSVYVSSNGTFGGVSSLRMRGADSGFAKIIVDGIVMNDPSNPSYSFEINQLDVSNIEQIEVLRGSQSVIYGSQAIGGVIKITTKKSKKKKTNLSLTAGSFNTKAMSFSSIGSKDRTSYSIGGSFYFTDGISSTNEKRLESAEADRYNRVNIKSLLSYKLNNSSSLDYQVQVLKSDLDIDSFGSDKIDQDNSSYDQNLHQLSYNSRHFADKLSSSFKFSYNEIYRNSESTSSNLTGEVETIDWQGTHYFSKNITNVYGLEHEKQQSSQKFDNTNKEKKTTNYSSAFIASHLKRGPIFFDIGLRHDSHKAYDGHTTYKIGLGSALPMNIVVKGTYATGFKAPTLSQLYSGAMPNEGLNPTESKSYDLTIQKHFKNSLIEVSYFNNDYKNQIAYFGTFGVNDTYKNINKSQVEGFETTLDFRLKQLAFKNSFTYTKSEDKLTGLELLKTPEKLWRTTLQYTIATNFNILTSFNYVGERFDFGQKRIPSYLVGNLVINYENFQAKVANLFDKEYEDTDTYGTPDRSYYLSYKLTL